MKILTIIGNGFDLGHALPTTFDDFINSNDAYKEKYCLFSSPEGTWTDLENTYAEQLKQKIDCRSGQDVSEIVEDILLHYGLNEYGEVDYYNYSSDAFEEEYEEIQKRIDLLSLFERDFQQYLKKHCNPKALLNITGFPAIHSILSASSKVIIFNYTHTAECVYGHASVSHIHGDIDSQIAIGTNALDGLKKSMIEDSYPARGDFEKSKYGLQEMMTYYTYDMEDKLVENHSVKSFFDEVSAATNQREEALFSLLDAKSKDALASRIHIIHELQQDHYDCVYIIGHALGDADLPVFDAINKSAKVICYYHSEKRCPKMERVLKNLKMNYTMRSDDTLYKPS